MVPQALFKKLKNLEEKTIGIFGNVYMQVENSLLVQKTNEV
jgi:hypothetical protein